jgi:hypothetical protein
VRKKLPISQWQPAFEGQRPPFEPGNTLSVGNRGPMTHGAYARLRLSEAAAETADALRELAVVYDEADEPTLQAFGFVLEQMKAASAALNEAKTRADRLRLSADSRGWALAALRYAESFGMTPRARAALGLDSARTAGAQLTVTRLARLVEQEEAAA